MNAEVSRLAFSRVSVRLIATLSLSLAILATLATLATLASPSIAFAADDGVAVVNGAVPYRFELEPHLVFGTYAPGAGQGSGGGVGVRGGVVVLPHGLIGSIDDSIAVGFGVDYLRYYGKWAPFGKYHDYCLRYQVAPDGTRVCTEVTSKGGQYNYVHVPVVVQWNFWFTRTVSAFAEPGVDIYHLADHGWGAVPALDVGARLRLSDGVALTLRLGYPTAALGLSILL